MIYPVKVERNQDGWWGHPALDELFGDREAVPMAEIQAWLDQHHLEMRTELFDEYEIDIIGEPLPTLEDWPLQPPGEAWFLLAVGDSEDGYFQHWARHKTPLDAIAAERLRQVEAEGWSPEHDDQYARGELIDAGLSYIHGAINTGHPAMSTPPSAWPWAPEWWKPTGPRRDLIKAAALIVAELERLERVEGQPT